MFIFDQKYRIKLSLCLMVLLIVLLPLFKGGNYPGAMSLFLFVMTFVFMLCFTSERNDKPEAWSMVWVVVSLAVMVHAFVFPLFLTNERFFVDGLSSSVSSLLGSESLSEIRLLEVWSYFSAMWIVVWWVSIATRSHVGILLTTLFFVSLFQALYGVFHLVSGENSVLGLWVKEYYLDDATGTFVNRNHFSGMLAIASPLVLSGLLISKPLIFPRMARIGRYFIAVLYSIFILVALISSHSRMGLMAGMFGFFVFLFILLKPRSGRREVSGFGRWKVILLVFSITFLFATWFGFADILYRYAQLSDGNSRLGVWKAMFSMPFDVWLFGVGPGQFEDVFQIVKPNYFLVRFIYAHNDYLEFVFEFGLICSVIIISAFIFWFKRLNLTGTHMLRSGVFGTFAAVALHSLVDFNLQVPASALFFCFAVGLLVNPEMLKGRETLDGEAEGCSSGNSKVRVRTKSRWPQNKREWLAFFRSE